MTSRPRRASVEFFTTTPPACRESGLLALTVCAAHPRAPTVGLRIWVAGDACCCVCTTAHKQLAADAAASVAKRRVRRRYNDYGVRLYLFEGRGGRGDLTRARRMRDAAADKLARLGYRVEVEDDRGGKVLVRARRSWRPTAGCVR